MKRILIVTISILVMFLQSCGQEKKDIFILPDNFIGYILILYNQNNGAAIKIENGNRIYNIPSSGVFKTKFEHDAGWKNFPEFYYGRLDPANKIPFKIDYKEIPTDSVVAYGGTSGAANKDLAGTEVVRFTEYYVGNKVQIDTAYQKVEKLDILKLAN